MPWSNSRCQSYLTRFKGYACTAFSRHLGKAMDAPWLLQRETLNNILSWLKLSTLPQVILVKFKQNLLKDIEEDLITSIAPDPEK